MILLSLFRNIYVLKLKIQFCVITMEQARYNREMTDFVIVAKREII